MMRERMPCLFVGGMAIVLTMMMGGCPGPGEEAAGPDVTAGAVSGAGGGDGAAIQVKGSDTLLQVAQALAEAYKEVDSDVNVSVTGGGSGTGFQALIEGTANIATASRQIKDTEADGAKAKGITPVEKIIGYDGIAVIVNKANPVEQATIDELSDVYAGETEDWAALGGSGEIMLVSRDTASGTFEYFKERVLQRGDKESNRDYADAKLMLPSNVAIRDQVATTASAIGYIGLGYLDDSVKALAIVNADGQAVLPSQAAVKDGTYSISRPLFMYTKQDHSEAVQEYLDWILGEAGQKVVGEEGFVGVE